MTMPPVTGILRATGSVIPAALEDVEDWVAVRAIMAQASWVAVVEAAPAAGEEAASRRERFQDPGAGRR